MLITEFFENQEIFITGGSGFIGKALIEKLLRSCPKIRKVFVLIRGKKGKTPDERLQEILKTSVFNRLWVEQPQTLRKIHAIGGDCAELGLGINAEDLLKLQNVSMIYHSAASVRFDEYLRSAILLNTRGTIELVKIALTIKKLQVFVHVSTTYCNPGELVLEEKVYPPRADWRTTIRLAETYDTDTLNIFRRKYSNNQPNTYTFTKGLAEQIIDEYKEKLPLIIFRPAIVISSMQDPMPGWIDNFNGPMGMITTAVTGILRSSNTDPDNNIALVPVDVVVRAMLITAYKKGMERYELTKSNKLEVINCSIDNLSPVTIYEMMETCRQCVMDCPLDKTMWLPGGSITRCRYWHFIKLILIHIIPAMFVDGALVLARKTPFLMRIQRQICFGLSGLQFFTDKHWEFRNEHFVGLDAVVPKSEIDNFGFMQFTNMDYRDYFQRLLRGAKEFLLNESPESSQEVRLRLKFFQVADLAIKAIFTLLAAHFVLRYVSTNYF